MGFLRSQFEKRERRDGFFFLFLFLYESLRYVPTSDLPVPVEPTTAISGARQERLLML